MKKIVITGPESSGKTTLAETLSLYYKAPKVNEFAVEYLTNINRKYQYSDLLKIAKGQIINEDQKIISNTSNLLICDTDLITIKIWSKVRFNKVSRWIMNTIRNRKYDHYFLCYPDIPWEYNKFRENPDDREWLFGLYEKEMKKYKKQFTIIRGSKANRTQQAIDLIDRIYIS